VQELVASMERPRDLKEREGMAVERDKNQMLTIHKCTTKLAFEQSPRLHFNAILTEFS
jgi:hypothetical protein